MIVSLRRLALAAVAILIGVAPATAGASDINVERISFDRSRDGRTLVARVHTSGPVRAYTMDQDGADLEVVLYRARLDPHMEREGAQGPIRAYRVEAGDDRVTLRFQVDPAVNARVYPDRDSDDLLLSFSDEPRDRPVAWGGVPLRTQSIGAPPAEDRVAERDQTARPRRRPITTQPEPARIEVAPAPPTVSAVPVSDASAAHWQLDTIILDAGHGGQDHGAVGNGTSDKEVAFSVIQRLGPMLERELGLNVVYTRTDDSFVELRERGRIANRAGGKLFISVHGNAGPSSAYGTETFFLAPRGQGNARSVMERENSVIELESDPELYADFHDEGNILQSLAMSAYQEESQHLARLIEGEFRAAGRHSRGVKQNNFIVLWAASMPAVLVEVGFVTNRDEARYLTSAEGEEETARAIFNAVKRYKESYERGLRIAGSVRG